MLVTCSLSLVLKSPMSQTNPHSHIAPSPGRSPCSWKELYRQAWWYVTKLPLPRDGGWERQRQDPPQIEDLQDCCKGGNWLGVRRLCATYVYTHSMFTVLYQPLALASKHSVDCLRILLIALQWGKEIRCSLIHLAGRWGAVSPFSC